MLVRHSIQLEFNLSLAEQLAINLLPPRFAALRCLFPRVKETVLRPHPTPAEKSALHCHIKRRTEPNSLRPVMERGSNSKPQQAIRP